MFIIGSFIKCSLEINPLDLGKHAVCQVTVLLHLVTERMFSECMCGKTAEENHVSSKRWSPGYLLNKPDIQNKMYFSQFCRDEDVVVQLTEMLLINLD